MSVAAIVLAAGRGTRFGESPKLLAELDGKPLVRHAVEAALLAGFPTLVVVGHRESEIRAVLADLPVTFVPNAAYAEGLSTSLKAGFAALPPDAAAALVLLGDMPKVTPLLLRELAETWERSGRPSAAVPVAAGRRGNPVLLSAALAGEIAGLTGDRGAGPLLRRLPDVVELPAESDATTLDVDTREALARLQACANTTPSSTAE
ncbi:nucleotidyltransferase family protein [Enterovirga aerilata]|uniref:Nucleotidyltransferase family protein n=1 Tax=Enterovirga aerilata TaxID=2730920 RepID=A0A849HZ74_9HYPH|nr:nucleotidyltransferase family protein [Enterovirga sp. DB1703]NNM72402.1 nucleotidyltransferase family protein [Enterovirga sp. DB1703]